MEITSCDISKDGSLLLICTETSLYIYDILTATRKKLLYNKHYKISNAQFFHEKNGVVYSTQSDPIEIHLWSIFENEIIKSFVYHKHRILNLQINPQNDYIVSSNSKELAIFDLSQNHQSPLFISENDDNILHFNAAFESTGLIICINKLIKASNNNSQSRNIIEMFDLKSLDKQAFACFGLDSDKKITDIKFSNDMKYILLVDEVNCLTLMDSFEGYIIHIFKNGLYKGDKSMEFKSCFSPDSKFIISAAEEGNIRIYDIDEKVEISKYEGHIKDVKNVIFNPYYLMFISIGEEVIFWVPKYSELS